MRDVNRKPHIREMKPVTQSDQHNSHNMMPHQLFEIFPRFFQSQNKDYELLGPIARLQQIVCLEQPFVRYVRKPLEHADSIEIPNRCPTHDEKTVRTENGEVHGRVDLFHKAILLCSRPNTVGDRHGADEPLHQEFAGEGQNDDVKGHEGEVQRAFAIVCRGGEEIYVERPRQRLKSIVWYEWVI